MFDGWSLLLGWGTAQGVLLAVVLTLKRRGNAQAHGWLALLILGFTSLLVEMLVIRSGRFFYNSHGHVVPLLTPVTFALGPLYFTYTRILLGDHPSRRHLVHFVLPLLALVNLLPTYLHIIADRSPLTGATLIAGKTQLLSVSPYLEMSLFILSLVVYASLSRRYLSRYEDALEANTSASDTVYAGWLRKLATVVIAVAVVTALVLVGMLTARHHVQGFELAMALAFSLIVHATGVITLWQPEVFASSTLPAHGHESTETRAQVHEPPRAAEARYERSRLTPDARASLAARLVAHMETKRPYLDPELSRSDLATQLDISPHVLSQLLSEGIGESFFDFVNRHRVEEVQRRMLAGESRHLTMLALALDSGFASKASFNRVFKKLVGQPPSAWLRDRQHSAALEKETSHPSG